MYFSKESVLLKFRPENFYSYLYTNFDEKRTCIFDKENFWNLSESAAFVISALLIKDNEMSVSHISYAENSWTYMISQTLHYILLYNPA